MVTRFLAANLLLPSFFLSLAIMCTAAAATVMVSAWHHANSSIDVRVQGQAQEDTARNDASCHRANVLTAGIIATHTQGLVPWSEVQPRLC